MKNLIKCTLQYLYYHIFIILQLFIWEIRGYIARMPQERAVTFKEQFEQATEHLSRAGEALFGKSSEPGHAWYHKYCKKLLEDDDGAEAVLRSIDYYGQKLGLSKSRREKLAQERTFFRRNKDRMCYADFMVRGLPIGSAPVEAACKSIVKTRLCRSGMRWSRQGGQRILYLRCFVKSNRWNEFWKHYIQLKLSA